MISLCLGNFEIVKYLVENDANVNAMNELGETVLMVAVREGIDLTQIHTFR